MKKTFFFIAALLLTLSMYAQTNKIGIDYFRLGEYEKAKIQLGKETQTPETNFYLGEIAFAEGNIDKAKTYYTAGLNLDALSLINQFGLIKISWNQNKKNAEEELNKLLKTSKKDINLVLSVGYFYLSINELDKVKTKINEAGKIDSKNPEIYILEGDMLAKANAANNKSEAGKYEMAMYFNPNFGLGYVKYALVYEKNNSNLAIDKLKTIIENNPTYTIAYGYLGRIYTQNGFYQKANEVYKNYFEAKLYNLKDIELYARSLYFANNYEEAQQLINEGLTIEPNHFVLNRLLMYITAKTKSADAVNIAKKFFSTPSGASPYIAMDYSIYATILNDANLYTEAVEQINLAITMEPNNLELYKQASEMAKDRKDFMLAAKYFKQIMAKKVAMATESTYEDDIEDVNTLGTYYYQSGTSISKNVQLAEMLMNNKNIVNDLIANDNSLVKDSLSNLTYFTKKYALYSLRKADSTFDILIKRIPDSYSGYRFKALTQHAMNPATEKGVAKPYYEKVTEIILDKEELTPTTKRVLLEAYNYLGYYFYMISDKPNTILYWNKVLALDPDNKNAKLVIDEMNKKQ